MVLRAVEAGAGDDRRKARGIDMVWRIRNTPAVSTTPSSDPGVLAAARTNLTAYPSGPLSGAVHVPGDKSMSHRALIIGALAKGQTRITGLLEGEDVLHSANAVLSFGAEVERVAFGEWTVQGGSWRSPAYPVDCGNSGTGARLLMGAAAGFPITATFTGDASLSRRPMERVLRPLRQMGARTDGSTLPVTIHGGGLHGIRFVNEPASAQVKSALLLAGLQSSAIVEIVEPLPTRDHTENMLAAFGCEVERRGGSICLGRQRALAATAVRIPGDPSSAAFPLVAALIVPGSAVTLPNVMISPSRAGLITTLQEMGADLKIQNMRIEAGETIADLAVNASSLHGTSVPSARAPSMIDEYPILAVAAAFASGTTIMRGLGELRVKESNRLLALVEGLRALGVSAREEGDDLVVEGGQPKAGSGQRISSHHDHRIAMSFLVFGLAAAGPVTVSNAEMIATSFPGFATLMSSIGAQIS